MQTPIVPEVLAEVDIEDIPQLLQISKVDNSSSIVMIDDGNWYLYLICLEDSKIQLTQIVLEGRYRLNDFFLIRRVNSEIAFY